MIPETMSPLSPSLLFSLHKKKKTRSSIIRHPPPSRKTTTTTAMTITKIAVTTPDEDDEDIAAAALTRRTRSLPVSLRNADESSSSAVFGKPLFWFRPSPDQRCNNNNGGGGHFRSSAGGGGRPPVGPPPPPGSGRGRGGRLLPHRMSTTPRHRPSRFVGGLASLTIPELCSIRSSDTNSTASSANCDDDEDADDGDEDRKNATNDVDDWCTAYTMDSSTADDRNDFDDEEDDILGLRFVDSELSSPYELTRSDAAGRTSSSFGSEAQAAGRV